ncbi:MAG: hypothetical protein ACI8TQ_001548 [Planctomycetota bacterium]|jgi:hypothetical protein
MMRFRSISLLTLLGLTLAACSNSKAKDSLGGSSPEGTGGTMEIVACSLGCNTFQTTQVGCTVNDVFVNEEIRILFSQPVKKSSLGSNTIQVKDSMGLVPPGTFDIDPSNPNGIIYRPLLTFTSSGSPVFGFKANEAYTILLPGLNLDKNVPHIESTTGRELRTRMSCTLTAGGGINDPVPGQPTVQVRVNEIKKDSNGNPIDSMGNLTTDPGAGNPAVGPLVLANNATDIHRSSTIQFTFNDVMNPSTLVDKVSQTSPSIRIFVDPDGDLSDPTDRVELFGAFSLGIDQTQLTTSVSFVPDTDFPSSALSAQALPRRVLITLPSTIVDLGENSLANLSDISFVPEEELFDSIELPMTGGETFATTAAQAGHQEDPIRSGAFWGPFFNGAGGEQLSPGIGGGSGRLGDLIIKSGEILTLYTDGMRPSIATTSDGMDIGQDMTLVNDGSDGINPITVTPLFDPQLFGPSNLVNALGIPTQSKFPGGGENQPAGAPLDFEPIVPVLLPLINDSQNVVATLIDNYDPSGTIPMNLVVDPGTTTFQVTDGIFEFANLDIAASGVLRFVGPHPPRLFVRGEALIAGRIELAGHDADQDHDSQFDFGGVGAIGGPGGSTGGNGGLRPSGDGVLLALSTPGRVNLAVGGDLTKLNGADGGGIPVVFGQPAGTPLFNSGGLGGTAWPDSSECVPAGSADPFECGIPDGFGVDTTVTGGLTFSGVLGCLSPSTGAPGSGGGRSIGGGIGVAVSIQPNIGGGDTTIPPLNAGGEALTSDPEAPTLTPEKGLLTGGSGGGGSGSHAFGTSTTGSFASCTSTLNAFVSNSGAGGGGGGGALQIQAGSRVTLNGVIDASGGKGGEPREAIAGMVLGVQTQVAPGGSGSGGSILIQTLNLTLPPVGNRLIIAGGPIATGLNQSTGGEGSYGTVRVEAGLVSMGSVTTFSNAARVVDPFDINAPSLSSDRVSVDTNGWERLIPGVDFPSINPQTGIEQRYIPSEISGAQSCWMRPEGNFFSLVFAEDDATEAGWTMDLLTTSMGGGSATAAPYRTTAFGSVGDPLHPYFQSAEGSLSLKAKSGGFVSKIQDSEDTMGGTLGSQFIVRFQGARAVKDIPDLCDVELSGAFSPIQPDSVTPWVLHPAELNTYWEGQFGVGSGEASKRQPTMIRYQIIFNNRAGAIPGFVGVDNVIIKAQPN